MNNDRFSNARSNRTLSQGPLGRIKQTWLDFWFVPLDQTALHRLRVLSGLLFLFWLLPFAGQLDAFFGLEGWFDRTAYVEADALRDRSSIPVGWSFLFLAGSDPNLLTIGYWFSIGVLTLFTLGLAVRITSVLSWLVVASFVGNPAIYFDADVLLVVLAFYLMLGYVLLGQWSRPLSKVERFLGPTDAFLFGRWLKPKSLSYLDIDTKSSYAANLAIRLFQVHFALILVVSGLHKLQIAEWWSGAAFWFPLHYPFDVTAESIAREAESANETLIMLSVIQYLALAWQLAFPWFAWRPSWRLVLLGGGVVAWLASAFMFEHPIFGPFIMIGCLCFVSSEEWNAILLKLRGRFGGLASTREPLVEQQVTRP